MESRKALVVLGALLCIAGALAALLIGRGGQAAVPQGNAAVLHVRGASMGASFVRPSGFADMVATADSAVRATVTSIDAGPLAVGDEPSDPGMPTQRITFKVDERLWGRARSSFVLFKTGSQKVWIDDDPPYQIGEQYVMFIRPRADDPSTVLNVGPDGRFKVVDGHLRPFIEGPVAARLGGLSVSQAKQATESIGGTQ